MNRTITLPQGSLYKEIERVGTPSRFRDLPELAVFLVVQPQEGIWMKTGTRWSTQLLSGVASDLNVKYDQPAPIPTGNKIRFNPDTLVWPMPYNIACFPNFTQLQNGGVS